MGWYFYFTNYQVVGMKTATKDVLRDHFKLMKSLRRAKDSAPVVVAESREKVMTRLFGVKRG